jgi:hypothetical protein
MAEVTVAVPAVDTKRALAQFFSTKADYIFQGFPMPEGPIVEPFAGRGDLIEWVQTQGYVGPVEAFDIMPQHPYIVQRDTLRNSPSYADAWVITNPPFIARNKTAEHRDLYDLHETNDLFKIFMMTLVDGDGCAKARGGYAIIPLNFLCSVRPMDIACRARFFGAYSLVRVNLFEEAVFDDTACTVIAIWFVAVDAVGAATAAAAAAAAVATVAAPRQVFTMHRYPQKSSKEFTLAAAHKWIIGGDIYDLPMNPAIKVTRAVAGVTLAANEQLTHLTFTAIDSGMAAGRICLTCDPDHSYIGEESSRTYATLVVRGLHRPLTVVEQTAIATRFNELFERLREQYWSLFLTNYRESKEYARKRAPFGLCYQIVNHLLMTVTP